MDALQRRLMLRESASRLEAARLLMSAGDMSDSAYLLQLLAFELLLKLLVEEQIGKPAPRHHHYEELFALLSSETRSEVLRLAGECVGPSALSHDHLAVLRDLGDNFIGLRYPHQKYTGLSQDEYVALGENWVSEGAPLDGATFRYHPEELLGLIQAANKLLAAS